MSLPSVERKSVPPTPHSKTKNCNLNRLTIVSPFTFSQDSCLLRELQLYKGYMGKCYLCADWQVGQHLKTEHDVLGRNNTDVSSLGVDHGRGGQRMVWANAHWPSVSTIYVPIFYRSWYRVSSFERSVCFISLTHVCVLLDELYALSPYLEMPQFGNINWRDPSKVVPLPLFPLPMTRFLTTTITHARTVQ